MISKNLQDRLGVALTDSAAQAEIAAILNSAASISPAADVAAAPALSGAPASLSLAASEADLLAVHNTLNAALAALKAAGLMQ